MNEKMVIYNKQEYCLQCGQILDPHAGRVDRKFCSQDCKNTYWNRRKYPLRKALVSRILAILDRNHDILIKLMHMGVSSLDRTTLEHLGFNEHYMTWYRRVGTRRMYGCYDIQYELTPSRIWRISSLLDDGPGKRKGANKKEGED